MKTSIIGYPRVGKNRELKFATEKYFRGEIDAQALEAVAKEIRQSQWALQAESGLDYIPSNDFSFYDGLLDTAVLLNIIPKRYIDLGVSALDTYFALARGHQDASGDVKALALRKWFNTNYHYLVPEVEKDTKIALNGTKPFDLYEEAKALGHETRPVVVGPFTVLKLAWYDEGVSEADIVDDIIGAYKALLVRYNELGVQWAQLDEPYLVRDLSAEDLALFDKLYKAILSAKGNVKVLLQTYFGDIRDGYATIVGQDVDGIGLDFLEGRKSLELVKTNGFPTDKVLFAGVVNGKNIWRNNYAKSLDILETLKAVTENIVISTSCSLLHVPYTTKSETKLADKYLAHFAYAEEKLGELADLKALAEDVNAREADVFKANAALQSGRPDAYDQAVQDRLANVKEADYTRLPVFEEREDLQHKLFNLPVFPTTTIGSFPQTQEVRANRAAFKKGEIDEAAYKAFNKKKIAECVALQEKIGLDVLVHGEFERNDMVEYFGEQLKGYLFTEKAWVQSYGTRCVKPPIIWGDVSREKPMTVEWITYAQSLTDHLMKAMLTGPVTILNWSFPREDISLKESTLQIALAIRDEVLDLEASGIKVIQVDEAALREKLPLRESDWYSEYLDWAIPAFRLVHSGLKAETQLHTHMCYSEFTDIIPAIDQMDADVITFEASRSDLKILDSLKANNFKTEVGPGVYDIHSPRVPSVEEIKVALNKMLATVEKKKLWVNPDCGLKTRGETETVASLKNLVAAAKELRDENN